MDLHADLGRSGGSLWESPVLWHQPEDGARLADLLDGLGLGTEASKDPAFDGVAGAPVPESDDTTAAPTSRSDTEPATGLAVARQGRLGAAEAWPGGVLIDARVDAGERPEPRRGESPSPLEATGGYPEVLAR